MIGPHISTKHKDAGDLCHVAGILSPDGGRRVVVTKHLIDYRLFHLSRGELLFVVPGYKVPDPVPHAMWSAVVLATDHHIVKHIRGINDPDDPNGSIYRQYLKRLKHGDIGERATYKRFAGGIFK